MNSTKEEEKLRFSNLQERDFAKVGNGLFVEHEVNLCGIVQLLTTSKKSNIKHKESAWSRGERNGKLELGSRPSLFFAGAFNMVHKLFSYEIVIVKQQTKCCSFFESNFNFENLH